MTRVTSHKQLASDLVNEILRGTLDREAMLKMSTYETIFFAQRVEQAKEIVERILMAKTRLGVEDAPLVKKAEGK